MSGPRLRSSTRLSVFLGPFISAVFALIQVLEFLVIDDRGRALDEYETGPGSGNASSSTSDHLLSNCSLFLMNWFLFDELDVKSAPTLWAMFEELYPSCL